MSAAQLNSQPAREVEPPHKADKQVTPSATTATGKMAGPSNAEPAASQLSSMAESTAELKGEGMLVSSAANGRTGEAVSPLDACGTSAQPCLPASTLPARSLLDVLLGGPPPLPAVPALAVPKQPASGGSSCALQEPGLLIADGLAIDKHDDKVPASPKPTPAEPAGRPLRDARPEESDEPESSHPMQAAAPSPGIHPGSTLLQPEQAPVKKLLSLRERLALLKGST